MNTLPTYENFMYPLLELFADGEVHLTRDMYEPLIEKFKLTKEQRELRLPSGKQTYVRNRIGWARTYLYKAGLIEKLKRGAYQITDEGRKVLSNQKITELDKKFLMKYDSAEKFYNRRNNSVEKVANISNAVESKDPEEMIEEYYSEIKEEIQDELLKMINHMSPEFFENLIIQLVVAMGYGGNLKNAGDRLGGTGDDGVDGTINEDVLGLEKIYLQAKRWKSNHVGSKDIRDFLGSLDLHNGTKGIFITTSYFSTSAKDTAERSSKHVILIDGKELTNYMFEYNVGVQNEKEYVVKKVDYDFFSEE